MYGKENNHIDYKGHFYFLFEDSLSFTKMSEENVIMQKTSFESILFDYMEHHRKYISTKKENLLESLVTKSSYIKKLLNETEGFHLQCFKSNLCEYLLSNYIINMNLNPIWIKSDPEFIFKFWDYVNFYSIILENISIILEKNKKLYENFKTNQEINDFLSTIQNLLKNLIPFDIKCVCQYSFELNSLYNKHFSYYLNFSLIEENIFEKFLSFNNSNSKDESFQIVLSYLEGFLCNDECAEIAMEHRINFLELFQKHLLFRESIIKFLHTLSTKKCWLKIDIGDEFLQSFEITTLSDLSEQTLYTTKCIIRNTYLALSTKIFLNKFENELHEKKKLSMNKNDLNEFYNLQDDFRMLNVIKTNSQWQKMILKLPCLSFKIFCYWNDSNYNPKFFQQEIFMSNLVNMFNKMHRHYLCGRINCIIALSDVILICKRIICVSYEFTTQFVLKNSSILARTLQNSKFSNNSNKILSKSNPSSDSFEHYKNYVCLLGDIIRVDETAIHEFNKLGIFKHLEKYLKSLESFSANEIVNKLRFCCFLVLYLSKKIDTKTIQFDEKFLPLMTKMLDQLCEQNCTTDFICFSIKEYIELLKTLNSDINKPNMAFLIPKLRWILNDLFYFEIQDIVSDCIEKLQTKLH